MLSKIADFESVTYVSECLLPIFSVFTALGAVGASNRISLA
jgi:hypothetical protein